MFQPNIEDNTYVLYLDFRFLEVVLEGGRMGGWRRGIVHLICFYSAPLHPIFHPPFSTKEIESLLAICRFLGWRQIEHL